MKNSEILQRYKTEIRSGKYTEIHDKYKKESLALSHKYDVKNKLSVPLAIIAVLLVIGSILCIIIDEPILFYILLVILIVDLIIRKINNKIVEHKENKNHKSSSYSDELKKLNNRFYFENNSVIGYFNSLIYDGCGDYDENSGNYYCSLTGKQLTLHEYYHQCNGGCAFNTKCPYSNQYYTSLYED